jgi:predicted RNase H-like HicB family nuclease
MEYRITITKDRTSGKFVLEVPDVPEAHTIGASKMGVIARGVDALTTALDGYMAARRPVARSDARCRPGPSCTAHSLPWKTSSSAATGSVTPSTLRDAARVMKA